MEKVTTEALMKLEIGEEIELIKNKRRFIRVPGGWIFETYYYSAHEKVVPLFIPEPQQELVEYVQTPEIKIDLKDNDITYQSPEHKAFYFIAGAVSSLLEQEKEEYLIAKSSLTNIYEQAAENFDLKNKIVLEIIDHG